MEDFFYHFGSQSLVDCELPQAVIPVANVPRGPAAQYSSEARMLLVEELKVRMAPGVVPHQWDSSSNESAGFNLIWQCQGKLSQIRCCLSKPLHSL